MSDQPTETSNQDGNNTADTTSTGGDEFRPITSQDDLNRVLNDRLQRERAKYADYKDVKAKAARFDAVEQASKSEIEKAMDRVTKAEAEVSTVPAKVADALRTHLVALHEIDADDAELFLTANDPELLLKQVARLTGRKSDQQKRNNVSPREGTTTTTVEQDGSALARSLFSGG